MKYVFLSKCLIIASLLTLTATPAPIAPILIKVNQTIGPKVEYWGWDLKGNARLISTVARAREFFDDNTANLLRIPIYANAHSADGRVDAAAYAVMLNSIRNALAVNSKLKIFASIKLEGATTFPAWVGGKTQGKIFANTVTQPDPEKYANLLTSYVKFLQDARIAIDYLGIDNETDGAVTASAYSAIWRSLKTKLSSIPAEYRSFKFVGPDAFRLGDSVSFINQIAHANALESVDIVGSHYYFGTGEAPTRNGWRKLSKAAAQRPMWFTEAHINQKDESITELRRGLAMIFSANIGGASGFVWWDPSANNNSLDFAVERELVRTMIGAEPVDTSPSFREQETNATTPLYQAYRKDNSLQLWIAIPGRAELQRVLKFDGMSVSAVESANFWRGPMQIRTAAQTGALRVAVSDDHTSLTIAEIPADSVCVLRFTMQPAQRN